MEILQDIKTALGLTMDLRRARKAGKAVQVKRVYTVPVRRLGYWGGTMEGCLFYGQKWQPLRDVFDGFPEETQHALTFTPKDGEWASRARFWQKELRPVLIPEMYHEAMRILLGWYIHCVRRQREEAAT